MNVLFIISWLFIGLLQFAAITNGFINTFGRFFGIVAAIIIGEMPIVGTIFGIKGAMSSWGWELWQALLLFIGLPIIVFFILYIIGKKK